MMNINIDCEHIKSRLDQGEELLLLDVREPVERNFCTIDGSVHIPMAEVPRRLDELDRECDIVVFCHHGARSFQVAAYLKTRGFDRVYNLSGGIDAWSLRVDPSVPRYS